MNRRTFLATLLVIATATFTSVARAEDKPHIGVSIPAATHGWPAGVGWWAEQAMKQHPEIQWEYQRASNAAEQAGQPARLLFGRAVLEDQLHVAGIGGRTVEHLRRPGQPPHLLGAEGVLEVGQAGAPPLALLMLRGRQ